MFKMNWNLFKKYKIVEMYDAYVILKRKGLSTWIFDPKRIYDNHRQAVCALYKLEKKKDVFTHFCSVKPTNKEYIIKSLENIGYIKSSTFDNNQKYIYTTRCGYIYSTDVDLETLSLNTYDTLYGLYCKNNDNLFLAISAINDRNDYMQWFYNKVFDYNMQPLPDHQFLCDQETLVKFGHVNNSPNTYSSGIHKKMNVESLIDMFSKNYSSKNDEFKAGDFLYGIPSSKESEKYNPEGERVFIYSGHKNGDGYGKLIGFHDHKVCKSSGWNNYMWGGDVRKATPEEINDFMVKVFHSEPIKNY